MLCGYSARCALCVAGMPCRSALPTLTWPSSTHTHVQFAQDDVESSAHLARPVPLAVRTLEPLPLVPAWAVDQLVHPAAGGAALGPPPALVAACGAAAPGPLPASSPRKRKALPAAEVPDCSEKLGAELQACYDAAWRRLQGVAPCPAQLSPGAAAAAPVSADASASVSSPPKRRHLSSDGRSPSAAPAAAAAAAPRTGLAPLSYSQMAAMDAWFAAAGLSFRNLPPVP